MKNILIVIFSLLAFANIYSQDKEPVQHKFFYPAYSTVDSVYLSDTLDFFKQDKFMLGWHWGGSIKISHALNMNQFDAHSKHINEKNTIDSSTYLILKSMREWDPDSMKFYTHCDNASQLIRAKAVQYEPTLVINSANMLNPNTNNYDNINPIFGFKKVLGNIENSENRSQLVLSGSELNGQVVLESLNYKNIFANYDIFL